MCLERLADRFAEALIVIEVLDLLYLSEGIKGSVVQVVHFTNVGIGHDDVGQLLHVSNTMCESVEAA